MRSIERNYKKIQNHDSCIGAYPCMAKAVIYKKFSRASLTKAFNKIMPKEEYLKSERKGLIEYLEKLTNLSEETEFCTKFHSGSI